MSFLLLGFPGIFPDRRHGLLGRGQNLARSIFRRGVVPGFPGELLGGLVRGKKGFSLDQMGPEPDHPFLEPERAINLTHLRGGQLVLQADISSLLSPLDLESQLPD